MVAPYEVLLKRESTLGREKLRRERVISHRQERDGEIVMRGQFTGDLGFGGALSQSLAAVEVRREIAVAQTEPRFASELIELFHDSP